MTARIINRPSVRRIAGKSVDIHELFVEVQIRGGYAYGRIDKFLWWAVAQELGVAEGAAGTASLLFRQAYRQYLSSWNSTASSS
jgi:hypothetical protein